MLVLDRATQTILRGIDDSYWIGIEENRLCVRLTPIPSRDEKGETDAMTWTGPTIPAEYFDIQLAIHMGMGPGGFLFRTSDVEAWSSLNTSAWHGPADAAWPTEWSIGGDVRVSCLVDVKTFE